MCEAFKVFPWEITGPALESHYRFLLWLVPAVERFPRSRKFLLGGRIQRTALERRPPAACS